MVKDDLQRDENHILPELFHVLKMGYTASHGILFLCIPGDE